MRSIREGTAAVSGHTPNLNRFSRNSSMNRPAIITSTMNAMEPSNDTMDTASTPVCDGGLCQYETSEDYDDDSHDSQVAWPISPLRRNSSDDSSDLELQTPLDSYEKEPSSSDTELIPFATTEHEYFQVGIPTFSNGLTTFGYQQVLRNRISIDKLSRYKEYDTRKYTPTFIHDALMLPGSLASLLGKVSFSKIPLHPVHTNER